ncbi:hypothetical protein MAR_032903 [Mya arenaria]|uniref:Uncharacterized protein n=1 Tax=Mya arenaria TaxID=6604 RepID=A0ABY7GBL4_MYAAR|nr:hypothetical protein MAR_032903 [Mya arenaria]
MVRHRRRDKYTNNDTIMNIHYIDITSHTTDSKGEGLVAPFESDTDRMYTYKYSMCSLTGDDSWKLPDTHIEFIMNGEQCHAGYFILGLKHKGSVVDKYITAALSADKNGRTYLSSPALTLFDEYGSTNAVVAFPCNSQEQLLLEWINRSRLHWPPPELIKEIKRLPAYLVPGSESKQEERRVCFTGEKKLIESFTESQYKLYIVLKFLNKHELKPICEELSRYIMINIVLWFFESNSEDSLVKGNMIIILISCLKNLKQAIKVNYLSYYLIPCRNLMTGRINPIQQAIAKLDELIHKGPRVILRCPKYWQPCRCLQKS